MVEEGERAENGSHRLLWIVWCRGYGMKLLRWPAMVGLRMGDDEGEDLVDGKEWSEKWCWEDWRRKGNKLAFKKQVRISHKVNSEVWKFSHSCDFPRPRACFLENAHKGNFAQGSHSCAFSHWDFWWGSRACFFGKCSQRQFRTKG